MSKPKVLLYDLETTPNISYTWGMYEQNVIAFKKEWELLSFSWKWLGEKKVYCLSRNDIGTKTDKDLALALKNLLEQADVVIAHNGMSFDDKKSNAKFIEHGLGPCKPYVSIDTKRIAKSKFMFNSNSLDNLGQTLGLGRKMKHPGFDMWLGCMAGDRKSFRLMEKYNKQDVLLLEKVYLKLLPWIEHHPHMNFIEGRPKGCNKCGHAKLEARGFRYTKSAKYRRYFCIGCRGWMVGERVKV